MTLKIASREHATIGQIGSARKTSAMRQLLIAVLAFVALVDGEYGIVGPRPTSGVERREETIWRRQDVTDAAPEELQVNTVAVEGVVEPVPEVVPAEELAGESAETPLPVEEGTAPAEDSALVESPGTGESLDTVASDTPEQTSDDAVAEEPTLEETPEAAPETNDTASPDVVEETTEPTELGDDPAEIVNLEAGANVPVDETVPEEVPANTETEPVEIPAAVADAPYNLPVASLVNDPLVPSEGEVSSDPADDAQVPEADTAPPATTVPEEAQESPQPIYDAVPSGETSAAEGEYAPITIPVDYTDSSLPAPASSAPPPADALTSVPAAAQPAVSAMPDEKEPTPVQETTEVPYVVPTTSEAATLSAEVKPSELPVVEVSSKDDTPDATSIAVSTSSVRDTTSSSDVLPPIEPTPAVPVKPTSLEGTTKPVSIEETTKPVPTEETTKSVPTEKATETTSIKETVKPSPDNETTNSTPIAETTNPTHTNDMSNPEETKTSEDLTATNSTPTTSTKDITSTLVFEAITPAKPDDEGETRGPQTREPTFIEVSEMPVTTASASIVEDSVPSQEPVEQESTTPNNAPVPGTTKMDTETGSTKVEESSTPTASESKSEEPVSSRKPVENDTPSTNITASPTMTDSLAESPTISVALTSTESQVSQTAEPVRTSRTRKLPLNLGGMFPTRVPTARTRDGGLPITTRPTKTPNDDTVMPGTTSVPSEQTPSPTNRNPGGKPGINLGEIISKPIAEATSGAGGVFQGATSVLGNIASQLLENPRPTRRTGPGGRPTVTPRPSLDVDSPSGDGDTGSMTAVPIGERPTQTPGTGRPTPTPASGDAEVPSSDDTDGTTTELPISKPTRTRGTVRGGSPTLTPVFPDLGTPTGIIDSITATLPTIPGRPTKTREPSRDGIPTTTARNPGLELPIGDGIIAIPPLLVGRPTQTLGTDRGGRPTTTALFPALEIPTGILGSLTAGLLTPGRPTRSRGTNHGGRPAPTPVNPDLERPVNDGILTALPIVQGIPTAVPTIRPGATTGTERPEVVPFPTIPGDIPQVPTITGNILTRLPLPSQGLGDIMTNLPLPPIVTDIIEQPPANVPSSLPVPTIPVQVGPQPPVGRPTPITDSSDPQQNPAIELPIPQLPALSTDVGDGLPRPTGLPTALPVLPSTQLGHVNPIVEGVPQTPKIDLAQPAVLPAAENSPISHEAAPAIDTEPPNAEPASPPGNGDPPRARPAPVRKPPVDQPTPGPPQGPEDVKVPQDPTSPATAGNPPAAQPNDATKPAPEQQSAPDSPRASDDYYSQNSAVPAPIVDAPSNGEQESPAKLPAGKTASASQSPAPEGDRSSHDTQDAPTDGRSESTFKPLDVTDEEKPATEGGESSDRGPIVAPEATKLDLGSQSSEPTPTKDVSDGDIDVPRTQVLMATSSVKNDSAEETDAPAPGPADESSTKAHVMTSIPTPTRLEPSDHTDPTTSLSTDVVSEITGSVTATAPNNTRTFLATRTHQGLVTAYSKTDAPAAPARTIGAAIGPDGHGIEIVAAGSPVPDIKAALKKQGVDYEAAAFVSSVEWRGLVGGVLVAMVVVVV